MDAAFNCQAPDFVRRDRDRHAHHISSIVLRTPARLSPFPVRQASAQMPLKKFRRDGTPLTRNEFALAFAFEAEFPGMRLREDDPVELLLAVLARIERPR